MRLSLPCVQLSLIPQVVAHTEAARKLMAVHDYYPASEHLGEAIEVRGEGAKVRGNQFFADNHGL